jgi:hypothetical protein
MGASDSHYERQVGKDLDAAFVALDKVRAEGLIVAAESCFDSRRDRIVALSSLCLFRRDPAVVEAEPPSLAAFVALAVDQPDDEVLDRFGRPFVPQEWFLVPLTAIDDAVEKIKDGTISGSVYDPGQASLVEAAR